MNRYIPAIITGFAVTPLIIQQILAQESGIYQELRPSIVLVQNEIGVRQGTGFIVSGGNGIYSVLTAGHVVQERQPPNTQLRIVTATGETLPVVAEVIPGRDLAVLQFRSTQQYRLINLLPGNADNLPLPTRIFVLGYSANEGRDPEILGGNISSRQRSETGSGISIFHTAPTAGGMSGSPVVTERGEVVGIHVGRIDRGGVREAIPLDQEKYKQIIASIIRGLASNNLEAGNYAEAIASVEQGRRQGIPDAPETPVILAYAYFGLGDFDRAREEVRRIGSTNANAALLLAAINYLKSEYPSAINNANNANSLDSRNLGGYALAIVGLSQAQNQASLINANVSSSNAIGLSPNDAFVNYARSCVRLKMGERDDAKRFYDIAGRLNRPIQDSFLKIIIPKLQEAVIGDCLSPLGVTSPTLPSVGGGKYRVVATIDNLESGVMSIAISRNGLVAVGMRNGTASVYNLQDRRKIGTFSSGLANRVIRSVALSPDGQDIAVASIDGEVKVFAVNNSSKEKYKIDGGRNPSVIFSDNGNFLFIGGSSGTLRLVNNRSGQLLTSEQNTHDRGISFLALSPNGRLLASGGGDGTVKLWSTADLTPVDGGYQAHQRAVTNLAFADGNQIISAGLDDIIESCNWQTKECREVARSNEVISGLAVASNGSVAFSNANLLGRGSNAILLQNITGQYLGDLTGHTDQVNALAYTLDGQFFVSGGDDKTLIIWQVQ